MLRSTWIAELRCVVRRTVMHPTAAVWLLAALATLASPTHAREASACPPVAQAPTPEQLQTGLREARDRGALWRLQRDGRTSYLYGTVHIGRLAWAFPGPQLLRALQETQVLAVEINPLAPGMQAQLTGAGSGGGAALVLTDRDRERLRAQADLACVPRERFDPLPPLLQLLALVSLSARHDGLDPSFGQEFTLLGFAQATQRPVVELETAALQTQALFGSQPADLRESFDTALAELETGRTRADLVRTATFWEQGDLDQLGRLEALCACTPTEAQRQAMKRINDDRNPGLARRIAEEHAKGKPLLAAVGLLHMTGPKALPALLEADGFRVERIPYR
jgi:uncharacterized protein